MLSRLGVVAIVGLSAAGGFAVSSSDGTLFAQPATTQWDGVYTLEQAERGERLYTDHCASCHGAELDGGDRAPGLAGDEFSFNWDGATFRELFELTSYSMPQDDPGSLSAQQNADVLAYMLHKGNYPVGAEELPTDLEQLDALAFVATRP